MRELIYPFTEPPDVGDAVEIVSGLLWLRLPLPFPPGHINCYLLEDEDGCYIVDTGLLNDDVRHTWEIYLQEGVLKGKKVKGVLVTHSHADHCGQAGWLVSHCEATLFMTQAEYSSVGALLDDEVGPISDEITDFYTRLGLADEILSTGSPFNFSKKAGPLPELYQVIREGDRFRIGGRVWQVVIGRGHSPEHACLYCKDHNLFIAGDQVIATITSNVSVWPTLPEKNPMSLWLKSIEDLRSISDETLILPAHSLPFYGLHQRLRQLKTHHENQFLALEQACETPQRMIDILPVLYERKPGKKILHIAVGECLARLHCLIGMRRMVCIQDQQGVNLYQTRDTGLFCDGFIGGKHEKEPVSEIL